MKNSRKWAHNKAVRLVTCYIDESVISSKYLRTQISTLRAAPGNMWEWGGVNFRIVVKCKALQCIVHHIFPLHWTLAPIFMNTLRFIVNTPTRRHGQLVNSWTLGRALTRADSRPRGGGGGHSLQMLHILLFVNVSQNLSLCQIQRYIGINLHKICVRVLAVCRRAEEPRQYPGQCRLYIGTQISKVTPRTTHPPPPPTTAQTND